MDLNGILDRADMSKMVYVGKWRRGVGSLDSGKVYETDVYTAYDIRNGGMIYVNVKDPERQFKYSSEEDFFQDWAVSGYSERAMFTIRFSSGAVLENLYLPDEDDDPGNVVEPYRVFVDTHDRVVFIRSDKIDYYMVQNVRRKWNALDLEKGESV